MALIAARKTLHQFAKYYKRTSIPTEIRRRYGKTGTARESEQQIENQRSCGFLLPTSYRARRWVIFPCRKSGKGIRSQFEAQSRSEN